MRIYADHPDRRASQIIADALGLLWCLASVVVGIALHGAIERSKEQAAAVERTGESLANGLGDAADTIDNVPLVGGAVADALGRAADAAAGLRDAGIAAGDFAGTTATAVGWLVPVLAIALATAVWLRPRVLWVREADDARTALRLPDGIELLAGRAVATVRLPRLAAYGPRLVQRWKFGDTEATDALARAELDRLGLAYQPGPPGPPGPPQ